MRVAWLVLLQILSGVCLTITVKYMYKQRLGEELFEGVYLQCMVSFLGQMSNFIIYYMQKQQNSPDTPLQKTSWRLMAPRLMLPALFHMLTQMAGFAAFMNINASLAMMIGSALPLVTALLSRLFLGTKIQTQQCQGMVAIILGSLVINSYTLFSQQASSNSNLWGLFFSNLSVLLFGGLIISEEICLKIYRVDSTLIAGFEGAAAFFISLLCIPFVEQLHPGLVNVNSFFQFFVSSTRFRMTCLGLLLTDMVYTLLCILVTKHLNGLSRAIIYQFRITGVWVVCLFLNNPDYLGGDKWEIFSWVQLIGYVVLLIGVGLFHGHLRLPSRRRPFKSPLCTPLAADKGPSFSFQELPAIK